MRKLTPEERAAKKASQKHSHTDERGHEQAPVVEVVAPVEEVPADEELSEEAPADDKPKRKYAKKSADAEEATEEA